MKKLIALAIAVIMICGAFIGCAKPDAEKEGANNDPSSQNSGDSNPAGQLPVSEALKGYTWDDGVILIDGVLYQSLYDPYSKFEENGWTFTWDQTLPGKTALIGGTRLYNEKYNGYYGPSIHVEFYNPTDEELPLYQCNIIDIEVYGLDSGVPFEQSEYGPQPCYDFEIPGGLKRGSSLDDVKAVLGEPDTVWDEEEDLMQLFYESSKADIRLYLFVSKTYGLQGVNFEDDRYDG